ncbi:MAG: hypothetical protein ABR607_03530 [Pyrinomonadaceae bacterium]
MPGYIFGLNSLDSLLLYTRNGVYATRLSEPNGSWRGHHEGTFADYATMKAGDNIYFFIQRKIYGLGKLINVGPDCKYFNFPGASLPHSFAYQSVRQNILWDEGAISVNQRCVCFFEPDPHFFASGVDMDDVLSSNPEAFKMLRVFWKLSFIKFDDHENQAFRDVLLKRNQRVLVSVGPEDAFDFRPSRKGILQRLTTQHLFVEGMTNVLSACADGDQLKHEMAIETGIIHQLSVRDDHTCDIFGDWDYISHQVVASPFKPVDYMDKMDLFGYAYVSGFKPTKGRFLVCEIKRGVARPEDINQLMKYVDWVKDEYCHGDYSMIRAFFVAHDFEEGTFDHKLAVGLRKYTVGVRPARSLEWDAVKLLRYTFNGSSSRIEFTVLA